jgi:hypothetical protein
MKVILHGIDDLTGMAKAAESAMAYEAGHRSTDGTDKLKDMGLRRDGKYYSVRFNKASVSVWRNEE